MKEFAASIFCIFGYGWALLGIGNIIMTPGWENETQDSLVFSFIFNGLLFVLPGLGIGSKGTDWFSKLKRERGMQDGFIFSQFPILTTLLGFVALVLAVGTIGAYVYNQSINAPEQTETLVNNVRPIDVEGAVGRLQDKASYLTSE